VTPPQPRLGVVEWFEPGEHQRVERVAEGLLELGIDTLRTGLSWADWHAPGGADWYDWLLPRLALQFELLPCLLYTPPSLGVAPRTSAPPRRPRDFADFVDTVLDRYGEHFRQIELWNEPNNREEWDWTLDPEWRAFSEMIGDAAYWARKRGYGVVLGGMSPIDPSWLWLMGERGVLDLVDVVGIHGFPGTWETNWEGWGRHVELVQEALDAQSSEAEIWVTEAGYSTVRHDDLAQLRSFLDVLEAPVQRVYWYAAEDLAARRAAQGGFHVDERDYHFGLRRADGAPKLLARALSEGGVASVRETVRLARRSLAAAEPLALVTGGAGFVGTNVADRLAQDGHRVRVFDNLSRPGVERNLRWLRERHGDRIDVQLADVRDSLALQRAVAGVDQVFHFAAQVAVTTSLDDPRADFEVNAGGTFNLLEALGRLDDPPPLVFTSTNKVYGTLPGLAFERDGERWEPRDRQLRLHGLDESLPLDFCTPYGCSKGAADQYVLDQAKSCGLPAAVFRMSCIYGPHQHGTEDQGWVAHFLLRALAGETITIYGDGAQVRDVLWVDDLVDALLRVRDDMAELAGAAFNVGGGADNSVSLLEVIDLIADVHGSRPRVQVAPARPGDQRYYVADTRRLQAATGWRQRVGVAEGIEELYRWLRSRGRATTRHVGLGVAAR
jgi:CDP-paratose 2-epimerase